MSKRSRDQSGIFLILLGVFLTVLVALCALAIGLTYIMADKVSLQNATNLAALGALDTFVKERNLTYNARATNTVTRANDILAKNSLLGLRDPSQDLAVQLNSSTGGKLAIGTYYRTQPTPDDLRCDKDGNGSGDYPCFAANTGGQTTGNAVQLTVSNANISPIAAPFANILGIKDFYIAETATASLVNRCTAFILDLSPSTIQETHPVLPLEPEELEVTPHYRYLKNPLYGSLFAYRSWNVDGQNGCDFNREMPPPVPPENLFWCNMNYYCNQSTTGDDGSGNQIPTSPPRWNWNRTVAMGVNTMRHHCQSDYEIRSLPSAMGVEDWWVETMVDSPVGYEGPQPFTRMMKAANAFLRLLDSQTNFGDRGMLTGFTGSLMAAYPALTQNPRMTTDIGLLAQLTNPANRGTFERASGPPGNPRYPNFLTIRLFPMLTNTGGSDLVEALQDAINVMTNNCPADFRKSIIMATDGISSCAPCSPPGPGCWECGSYPEHYSSKYMAAENTLLSGILPQLQSRRISLTVITDGDFTGPHIMNIADPNNPGSFLSPEEAFAQNPNATIFDQAADVDSGYSYDPNTCQVPGDASSECENEYAFVKAGDPRHPGVKFRRGAAVIQKVAIASGGYACPLMPLCRALTLGPVKCPSNLGIPANSDCSNFCYEDKDGDDNTPCTLKDSARVAGQRQTCSLHDLTKTEQGEECAKSAVSNNPYMLVELEPNITNAGVAPIAPMD